MGDKRMEGWLYLIRSNGLGLLQYSKKRYFILEENSLKCYKFMPTSKAQDLVRSAPIDSCVRVMDNGRQNIHKNEFYTFTLYNSTNRIDRLKLGARSSEEAAQWIRSLTQAALEEWPNRGENFVACSKKRWQSLRLNSKRRSRRCSIDWTAFPSAQSYSMSSDVIAPSPWTIFGCKNGLRLFKEARDGDVEGKHWDDHPAIMAVGVVEATSEAIFRTVMSLGPSRSEWDFCFSQGHVVEQLDGHTDVIHKKLNSDWLPWGMKRRDLLLQRYWRREDDGTYMILYHSVFHPKCRPEKGYVRACLKSGGFVITPVNQGKQSVVKHMLSIDWKFWKSYVVSSSSRNVTMQMIGRVAALRELFRAKHGNYGSSFSEDAISREIGLPQCEVEDIKREVQSAGENNKAIDATKGLQKSPSKLGNNGGAFLQLNDVADEFFDVLDEPEHEARVFWPSDAEMGSEDQQHSSLSTAAIFVKKLHELAVQKKGYVDLNEPNVEDMVTFSYGSTLPKDSSCTSACTWAPADPLTFFIRGQTYLQDNQKVRATCTMMQLIAADWLKSDKREDDLGGRPGGIVQKYASQCGGEFFFIVNIQVPGATKYNLAFYYMSETPLENIPLLKKFVEGDDAFRNSRFKLIPYISKGSWIVKQSVGKKACLVGQGLEINYFRGDNYLEVGIDVGSSTVAKGVVSLVLSYLNNLVIEMAFLIQGNTAEELPEVLLGTCRVNHLDATKAVPVNLW